MASFKIWMNSTIYKRSGLDINQLPYNARKTINDIDSN